MNFLEEKNISGHLQIVKLYKSGQEEVVLDDSNIIVSGMGLALSHLFGANGSNSIYNYQIGKFQIGVSGPPGGGVTSSIYELSGPLSSTDEYGLASNLVLNNLSLVLDSTGGSLDTQAFAEIPYSKITRIGDTSVRYTLVLDEDACNGLTRDGSDAAINEVGLFVNNFLAGVGAHKPKLVAYRTFSNIYKTSDFSLIFRWTINF